MRCRCCILPASQTAKIEEQVRAAESEIHKLRRMLSHEHSGAVEGRRLLSKR
jgi:hypothetical protein